MKLKYFFTVIVLVLTMTAGCTTAEKASTASNENNNTPQSTVNAQETNDTPPDSTVSDNNENIESENSEEKSQDLSSKSNSDSIDISADWSENVTDTVTDYEEYIVNDSDYSVSIMFTANNPVSDFKIVSLQYEDFKEDGTPKFLTNDVYDYGDLTPEQSLLVKLSFSGDMPNYGVSYTDSYGTEKHYALQQSGKDGSLVMFEFE